MVRLVLLMLLLCAGLPVAAQLNPTLSEAERGIRSGTGGEAEALRVAALSLTADVAGHTATVTVEALIRSDRDEPYEANLTLRLPAGAVVTGYALDVEGRIIPGQLLEAPRAREVYEDEVRERVDPGLAEIAGNRFTTRIYPVDRTHPRRFRVTFAVPFDPSTGLDLPLLRDVAPDRIEARVTVAGYRGAPEVRFAGERIALKASGGRLVGSLAADGRALRDGFSLGGGTLAGAALVARHAGGARFFVIEDVAAPVTAPPMGGRLRVYWDRSRSHRDGAAVEIEALLRLVDALAPDAIDLVTFASDRPQASVVPDRAALRAALERVTYRGGTSLVGLDALKLPAAARCVLVFDGRVTIDRATSFQPDCLLSALTGAADADVARLARLVRPSGGAVVRAGPDDTAALLAGEAAVRRVADGAGQPIATVVLPAAKGRWALAGEMPADGLVRVTPRGGGARVYRAMPEVASDAAGALWAMQRVADLSDDPSQHEAMLAIARRYGVAGPGLSLLVLETPDQYLRAGLTPPDGFGADWTRRYQQMRADQLQEKAEAVKARFTFVAKQWAERKDWWARRFTPLPRPKPERAQRGVNAPPAITPPAMVMSAPPAPLVSAPPPPPPPPPMEPGPAADGEDLIVTGVRIDRSPAAASTPPAARPGLTLDLADLTAARPYIAALAAATADRRLAVLDEQERAYGAVPAFYLDTAEWFRARGDANTAALLLLSALDLATTDDETRQIVAFRLERDGAFDRAVELAEWLATADAGGRPQPKRDLALALAARGRSMGAAGRADLERALELLTRVALDPASDDFDGIEVIALEEANALLPAIEAAGGRAVLDPALTGRLDYDARIVIAWTADDADIDLWADEPNGERVMYSNPLSSAGGRISNDMTDGFGPEEYAIRRAPSGRYAVRINGYDADRINPNGPGHVLLRLQRNFARAGEAQVMVDADLSFQGGANRNREDRTRPIATLQVAP